MTVTQQQTLVAQLLGDTDNKKWDATTAILPAFEYCSNSFCS